MRSIHLLFATMVLLGSALAQSEKQNVLFIAVDDLNNYVGCLGGHPQALTPNIDRLAARGTLFSNAHCQAPICGPSRASLMSGIRPSRSGIYLQIKDRKLRGASEVIQEATFLPDYLEQQGYRTAGCGKIFHQGDAANFFDEFGHGTNYGPRPKQRMEYDPAWFEDRIGKTSTDWGTYPEDEASMPDHKTADWVVHWLEQQDAGEDAAPFFLAAGFVRPHVPWYTTERWYAEHPLAGIELPPYLPTDGDDLPAISLAVNEAPQMPAMDWVLKEGRWQAIIRSYLACTTFVDHQIGRVLDALEASRFAENTIVILWSDHGYHLGEKGRFAKQSLWRQASHVPLIIAGPELPSGQICSRPVQLLDMYPTLLDLLKLPKNDQNDGHSLLPLLQEPTREWPFPAITTYGPNNHAIQTDRYRYIQFEDGSAELYDHHSDPNEWRNLANDPKHEAIVTKLKAQVPTHNAANAIGSYYDFNRYFKKMNEGK